MGKERNIAVLGAGTMGAGIAELCALRGFKVALFDVQGEVRKRAFADIGARLDKRVAKGSLSAADASAIHARLELFASSQEAVRESSFVIEAVPEDLALKARVLLDLLPHAPADCTIASNT